MSYILLLPQKFNTFFPGCSTQDRLPTGEFQLEVNIEMKIISGTWRAWEEVVGHQTQPNCIWRFICSNISSNVIIGKYNIPKKVCPGSNRGKRGGHSRVIFTCNLVGLSVLGDWWNDVLLSSYNWKYHTYVQEVCSILSRYQSLCTDSFSVEESVYMIIGFGASTIFAAEMVKYKSQSSRWGTSDRIA